MSPSQWSDIYITAASEHDAFNDVKLITLRSDYLERLYEEAIRDVGISSERLIKTKVKELADRNLPSYRVQERVEFKSDGTTLVVMDIDTITDDTVWMATEMIDQAVDKLDGEVSRPSVVTFSHPTSFEYQRLVPLMTYVPQSPAA